MSKREFDRACCWLAVIGGVLAVGGCTRDLTGPEGAVSKIGYGNRVERKAVAANRQEVSCVRYGSGRYRLAGDVTLNSVEYFAIRDNVAKYTGWYRIGDAIGEYIVSSKSRACLLLKGPTGDLLGLRLSGVEMGGDNIDAGSHGDAKGPPMLTLWSSGVAISGSSADLNADLVTLVADSKQSILGYANRVDLSNLAEEESRNLAQMLSDALTAKTIVVASGKSGFERSDFPVALSSKMSDSTLNRINQALLSKKDPTGTESQSTGK